MVQAVMSTKLEGYLRDLVSLPPHTAAPAMANLIQAMQSALAQYPNSRGLQRLFVGLVQQALTQLMDKAATCVAALPVMGSSECQTPHELRKLLLTVLGQVCPA